MGDSTPETIRITRRADGMAFLTLARPQVHNAFNEVMIAKLTAALADLGAAAAVRAVVLCAEGRSFSAGADLDWMRRMAGNGPAENREDARALARLMHVLDTLPKPTVARVHGAAYGGGVGLVACCDIALASDSAAFSLSEVRLGLIPAVISPYVVAAVGPRAARRWFLAADRFDAAEAGRHGLVHQVVAADALDGAVEEVLARLRLGAPAAQAAAKRLVSAVTGRPITAELMDDTANRIADIRAGAEAREGIGAFLDKRMPAWGN